MSRDESHLLERLKKIRKRKRRVMILLLPSIFLLSITVKEAISPLGVSVGFVVLSVLEGITVSLVWLYYDRKQEKIERELKQRI